MAEELKTERVQLMMTPSEVEAIDNWSFENRVRGRAEAMRRLIEIGLEKAAQPLQNQNGARSSKHKKTSF